MSNIRTADPVDTDSGATRGNAVSVQTPDLGRCIDGITEFGFVACETPVVAVGPPPVPTTVAGVAQPPRPAAPVQTLPATGMESTLLVVAVTLLALGTGVRRLARR